MHNFSLNDGLAANAAAPVRLGVDRLDEYAALFRGLRLGLITGASGLTSQLECSIDALRRRFDLRVLLAPEHGIRGVLGPGETVHTHVDALSGLPTYSLFEDRIFSDSAAERDRAYLPPAEALRAVDALVFDLQDAGSRYFTYASTLFYAMRACAASGKRLFVLDRPNPLGGLLREGNCHDPALFSFIGLTPVPIRHGMTLGELALYYNGEHHLGCDLCVIPLAGWRRGMLYPDTGLPFTPPSPNLPTMEAVTVYNGSCLLAGTNVSEGRGTTTPFTLIGAPFVPPQRLADALSAQPLPGLRFAPAFFCPAWGKYAGQSCAGVRIYVTDAAAVRAVAFGVRLVCTLRQLCKDQFAFTPPPAGSRSASPVGRRWHIDLASGSSQLRCAAPDPEPILADWDAQAAAFAPLHAKYALYPA